MSIIFSGLTLSPSIFSATSLSCPSPIERNVKPLKERFGSCSKLYREFLRMIEMQVVYQLINIKYVKGKSRIS